MSTPETKLLLEVAARPASVSSRPASIVNFQEGDKEATLNEAVHRELACSGDAYRHIDNTRRPKSAETRTTAQRCRVCSQCANVGPQRKRAVQRSMPSSSFAHEIRLNDDRLMMVAIIVLHRHRVQHLDRDHCRRLVDLLGSVVVDSTVATVAAGSAAPGSAASATEVEATAAAGSAAAPRVEETTEVTTVAAGSMEAETEAAATAAAAKAAVRTVARWQPRRRARVRAREGVRYALALPALRSLLRLLPARQWHPRGCSHLPLRRACDAQRRLLGCGEGAQGLGCRPSCRGLRAAPLRLGRRRTPKKPALLSATSRVSPSSCACCRACSLVIAVCQGSGWPRPLRVTPLSVLAAEGRRGLLPFIRRPSGVRARHSAACSAVEKKPRYTVLPPIVTRAP
eukprot:scaffold55253_cov61-Phaeocystis_antarctica.AAC.24